MYIHFSLIEGCGGKKTPKNQLDNPLKTQLVAVYMLQQTAAAKHHKQANFPVYLFYHSNH